jgi:hypothetical protein
MSRKYSNIDDLFRDKFKDFELNPPDHIWEHINKKIKSGNGSNPGKPFTRGGIFGISTIIILIGLFSLYQLSNDANNYQSKGLAEPETIAYNNLPGTEHENANPQNDIITRGDGNKSKKNNKSSRLIIAKEDKITKGNLYMLTQTETVITKESSGNLHFESPITFNSDESVTTTKDVIDNINPIQPGEFKTEVLSEMIIDHTIDKYGSKHGTNELTAKDQEPNIRNDYGEPGSLLFGLHFTPELQFYPSDEKLTSRSYSLDLSAIYRFSGFLVQTGVGTMWTSDNGNYKVDYHQYLGSYEDVYNITFDTTGGEVVPTYYTETVKVYDTLDHVYISPTKNKYTYLTLPLLFGYGNEGRHFNWFLKVGPSISLLINKNVSNYYQSDDPNKIISVENDVPSRLHTNWQIVMSGGISLGLNQNLSISLEPIFRYYIKSAYEQNRLNSKNPYSVGLRAGFLVNF